MTGNDWFLLGLCVTGWLAMLYVIATDGTLDPFRLL